MPSTSKFFIVESDNKSWRMIAAILSGLISRVIGRCDISSIRVEPDDGSRALPEWLTDALQEGSQTGKTHFVVEIDDDDVVEAVESVRRSGRKIFGPFPHIELRKSSAIVGDAGASKKERHAPCKEAIECVHKFVQARCCYVELDQGILAGDLYGEYKNYCSAQGIDPMSQRSFGMRMGGMEGCERKRRGRGMHWWMGIALKSK
jgi:hypothetical protein